MYINKKSIPQHLEIDVKLLTKSLIEANEEYGSFEQQIIYKDVYIINLKNTYKDHKTKGQKWDVESIKVIYAIENNQRFSYQLSN